MRAGEWLRYDAGSAGGQKFARGDKIGPQLRTRVLLSIQSSAEHLGTRLSKATLGLAAFRRDSY